MYQTNYLQTNFKGTLRQALKVFFILCTLSSAAQIKTAGLRDTVFPTFYQQRTSLFRVLPRTSNQVVFLGNSITNGSEWSELFDDSNVINRGISGDVVAGILNRIDEVIERKPAKVFILIGINDLAAGRSPDTIAKSIIQAADMLHKQTPATKVYVQSILPVNAHSNKFQNHVNKREQIKQVNSLLKRFAADYHYTYIDINSAFCDSEGNLDTLYTNDGLHHKGPGYMLWKHLVYPFVYDLQEKPSLLPMPNRVMWTADRFLLYRCRTIVVTDTLFNKEAALLKNELDSRGWVTSLVSGQPVTDGPAIVFQKESVNVPKGQAAEAYRLSVNKQRITIAASTSHGAFNALQTLTQLFRDNAIVPGVEITDYPAFPWRAYMVDVARNYQSMDLIKEQIAIAARYKLNTFHLHLTEDIAWRLQIRQFPELTKPDNMTRNAGAYYTIDEIKELIAFCKARHMTFVPEIDMPGHSAAFRKTFGVDMQTDSGLSIVKKILKEVCETYDVPYLHIGGDEVKITNKQFLPTVISYIHQLGKQTIGWSPGGNLDTETIRQLWMKEGAVDPKLKYIDSRNLYINHMDPLESVVSIYNKQIGDVNSANANVLGATVCLWPDRNVIKQEDVMTMNPVYPAMIAFAERSWVGKGKPVWSTAISQAADGFSEFETRLVDQQKQYFKNIKFAYVQQANMNWKLIGPYDNGGQLSAKFALERPSFSVEKAKNYQPVTGGTIIMRHFWYPAVQSILPNPKTNTTYYATARVWSDEDYNASMWIGFYNISRSVATSTPSLNTWDDRESAIWVNHTRISPPVWAHAGNKATIESPLVDEGYEYRKPISVPLRKGWNEVLVKIPVKGFNETSGQSPVKWMFTAAFITPLGVNYIYDNKVKFADVK